MDVADRDHGLVDARLTRAIAVVFASLAIVGSGLLIERAVAGTALVTPVPARLLARCELGGAGLGVLVALLALRWASRSAEAVSKLRWARLTLLLGLAAGLAGLILGYRVAWRAAELTAFTNRRVATNLRLFRVLDARCGKGGCSAWIEPYPAVGATELSLSQEDYAWLRADGLPTRYCYPLWTQQAGDAVRVYFPRRVRAGEPRHRLIPCSPANDASSTPHPLV